MAKYLYLLEDVYVIMHELRGNTVIDNSNGNLGLHCDICFKKGESYYWMDESCVQLKRIKNNRYFDASGNIVALIPVSITNDGYYNKDLPYIGGKSINVKTETMNGKVYVASDALHIIKCDYNVRLERGVREDIKHFKEQIKKLKSQKKANKKAKGGR